jgi:hypothetical protein
MDSFYAFKCKLFLNTSHRVRFGMPYFLWKNLHEFSNFWNTLCYEIIMQILKIFWLLSLILKVRLNNERYACHQVGYVTTARLLPLRQRHKSNWSFISFNVANARCIINQRKMGGPFPELRLSKSKWKLSYKVGQSVLVTIHHQGPLPFFFLLEIFFRQLRVCYFVAPSLTRGRICNLLLLLGMVSTVPPAPSPAGPTSIIFSSFREREREREKREKRKLGAAARDTTQGAGVEETTFPALKAPRQRPPVPW